MNWRAVLAANRANPALRLVNAWCGKFQRAYDNQYNWDIVGNGELFIVRAVTDAEPGIVLDVGANIGTYSRLCAALPGVTEVHAFEISPPTFTTLSANCRDLAKVQLNAFGLGDINGSVTIHHVPESNDRTSQLVIDDGYAREAITAEIRTGDDYLRDKGIVRVAFLKIDVEGCDLATLKGFAEAFSAGRVGGVQFEHGEPSIAARTFLGDITRFLSSFGFQLYRLFPDSLERLENDPYMLEDFRGRNYVALQIAVAQRLGYPSA